MRTYGASQRIECAEVIKELTQNTLEFFQSFNRKTWGTHIHPDDRKGIFEKSGKYREKRERLAIEYRFRRSLRKVEELREKEIHHHIKNNLQVISSLLELQAERFCEKEVLKTFRENQNRVVTMAIIHEELYRSKITGFSISRNTFKNLLQISFTYILSGKTRSRCLWRLKRSFLGMDTAVPLGITIDELVSNYLKHAVPQSRKGEIRIKLCRVEENRENKTISNSINITDVKSSVEKSSQYFSGSFGQWVGFSGRA